MCILVTMTMTATWLRICSQQTLLVRFCHITCKEDRTWLHEISKCKAVLFAHWLMRNNQYIFYQLLNNYNIESNDEWHFVTFFFFQIREIRCDTKILYVSSHILWNWVSVLRMNPEHHQIYWNILFYCPGYYTRPIAGFKEWLCSFPWATREMERARA